TDGQRFGPAPWSPGSAGIPAGAEILLPTRRQGCQRSRARLKREGLDTATTAQDVAPGPDRETSTACSTFNCAGSVESVYARHCVRGRCEPRTARGPVAAS